MDQYHNLDATDVFYAFHGKEALDKLNNMTPLKESTAAFEPAPEVEAFRKFRSTLEKDGWFESDKFWFAKKTTETLGLSIFGLVLAAYGHWFIGAIILGLGYQQQGWLSHDYCHQQVFQNRRINNFFAYVCGSVFSGYSVNWWKERHNTHHAITNVLDADPDLDNLPLFVWDEKEFPRVQTVPGAASLIPYQQFYFLPWTMTLKLIWNIQSVFFVRSPHSAAWNRVAKAESMCIILHYTWIVLFSIFCLRSLPVAILFYLISEFVGGAGIANIVFMNHYACEHPETMATNFVQLQLNTTKNVDPSWWMNWFSGGLNLQIEHHLFPTMPRHNLLKVRPLVQRFCKENRLPYQSSPFRTCMKDILKTLTVMATKFSSAQGPLTAPAPMAAY